MARPRIVGLLCAVVLLACLVASGDAARNENGNGKETTPMLIDWMFGEADKAGSGASVEQKAPAAEQKAPAAQKQQPLSSLIPGDSQGKQEDSGEDRRYKQYKGSEEYKPSGHEDDEEHYGYRKEEDEYYRPRKYRDEHDSYEEEHSGHYGYKPKRTSICLMENKQEELSEEISESEFRCCKDADNPLACNEDHYGSDVDFADDILGLTAPVGRCTWRVIDSTACDSAAESEDCVPYLVNCTISSAAQDCGCSLPGGVTVFAEGVARYYDVLACNNATTLKGHDALNLTQAYMFRGPIKYIQTKEGYKEVKGDIQFVFEVLEGVDGLRRHHMPLTKRHVPSKRQIAPPAKAPIHAKKPQTPHAPVRANKPQTHAPVDAKKPAVPPHHAPVGAKKPQTHAPVDAKKPVVPPRQAPVDAKKPQIPHAPVDAKKPQTHAPVDAKKPAVPPAHAPVDAKKPQTKAPIVAKKHDAEAPVVVEKLEAQAPVDAKKPETEAPVDAKKPEAEVPIVAKKPEAEAPVDAKKPEAEAPVDAKKPEAEASVDAKKADQKVGVASVDYARHGEYDPSHYYPYIVTAQQLTINFIEGEGEYY